MERRGVANRVGQRENKGVVTKERADQGERAEVATEDERDRVGPQEQGRESRDRKSTLRREKRGIEAGRGNKPDGEFEGDEVNGDRRRMDGEERQASRQAEGSAGGSQRGRHGRSRVIGGKRRRPSGLKSSIARIFAVTSRKSCDRPLVYFTSGSCRASDMYYLPRISSSPRRFFVQPSVSIFILHPSFLIVWMENQKYVHKYIFFLVALLSFLSTLSSRTLNSNYTYMCCILIFVLIENCPDTRFSRYSYYTFFDADIHDTSRIYQSACAKIRQEVVSYIGPPIFEIRF